MQGESRYKQKFLLYMGESPGRSILYPNDQKVQDFVNMKKEIQLKKNELLGKKTLINYSF